LRANCALCDTPITSSNDSAEHLIQNAIGGTRTIRGFLCKPCNDTSGQHWDAELAKQLNGLCHFFAIKRDRGSIPADIVTTTAGERFKILPDGGFELLKPTVEKKQNGEYKKYQITARSMSEGRDILEGIKRKSPNLDIEAELAKAKANTSYPEGMIHIPVEVGGAGAGRAVVKSAVALAYESGIPVASCDQALAYLRNSDALPCFGWYQSTDPVVARPSGVPLHCVAISGNPMEGLLLGYVEYFGLHRAIVCLSQAYSGMEMNRCYAIDPTIGKEVALSVRLDFTRADLADIFDYKHCDAKDILRAAHEVFGPAMERKRRRDWDRAVKEAIQYGWDNCGAQPGELLTADHMRKIAQLMKEKLDLYVANLRRPRPLPPGIV
jgi:HNH endonuclease